MLPRCTACGCTELEAIADAKTLGVYDEFHGGVYTCCQVAVWAHDQWLAWFEATSNQARDSDELIANAELQAEAPLVPLRFRQPVPWFRNI